jgi:hypothetical protein
MKWIHLCCNKQSTWELPLEVNGISSKLSSRMAHEFGDSTTSTSLGNDKPITQKKIKEQLEKY